MFSPVKKVLIEAARSKYLQGWPGFTQAAICKDINIEEATVKGYLNQARQGVRSTQVEEPEYEQEPDQTGRFLRVSSRGYWYIMVAYIYDSSYIEAVLIKNRTEG
eukprot:12286281-Ditylum_brightwellii.AAC.1